MPDSLPPTVTAPTPKKSRKKRWIILGGILVLFVIIAAASSSSSGHSSTAQSVNGPTVKEWITQNRLYINQLGTDTTRISKDIPVAVTSGSYTTVISDCTSLEVDAQAAQLAPPIPNAVIEKHWSSGLSLTVAAAKDCTAGIEGTNVALVSRFKSELSAATVQMQAVAAAVAG